MKNASTLTLIKPEYSKWSTSFRISRNEEITVGIGQCQLTQGYLLRSIEASTCEKCRDEPKTVQHLQIKCPKKKE